MDRAARRAVITGIGAVTPIGIGKEALWQGVLAGRSPISRPTLFDCSPFRSHVAAEVTGFDASDYLDAKRSKRLDRFAQFSVVAARLAVDDSGLDMEKVDRSRTGVTMGSALGGIAFAEEQYGVYRESGVRSVDPSVAVSVFCGSASCNIAIEYGLTGPVTANSNSCASGTIALGEALSFIRRGDADVVIAGGAEAPLAQLCFGAFAIIRAMSCCNDEPEKACRPFDKLRDGFVMGEGAAVLVVEDLEHAVRRGARIYAEILGYGLTNDAYHMTAPHPEGQYAARAMSIALDDAGVSPTEIDYINAHGSSTPLNDKTETMAIRSVFGEYADRVPISGTKPLHGHSLGAVGTIEAAISILAMENNFIPPTINLEHPDPECDLDYVPLVGREKRINRILSNSFGFGGINACVVLGSYE
ncbi:MAG TPA: beta-ketoacyl-ACP synthase II [Armatimonadota bacterium]|nr:beta-ketoacyl-ACP synthase II [Armatimonadota bacterium]